MQEWYGPMTSSPSASTVALSTAAAKAAPTSFKSKPKVGTKAHCPVMKADFKITASTLYSKYKGRYYFFCCPGCKPKFDANPKKYAGR